MLLSEKLKELRKKQGKTQQDMVQDAFAGSVSINTYRNWEQDKREASPSLEHRVTLARYYNIPLDALLIDIDMELTQQHVGTCEKRGTAMVYEVTGACSSSVDEKAVEVFEKVIEGEADLGVEEKEAVLLLQHAIDRRLVLIAPENLDRTTRKAEEKSLEERLKEQFEFLEEAYVYDFKQIRSSRIRTVLLGIAAAQVFREKARNATVIGIANGLTVSRVTRMLDLGDLEQNVVVFPLTTSDPTSRVDLGVEGRGLVADLAYRLGVKVEENDKLIKPRFETADLVLMGLGTTFPKWDGLLNRVLKATPREQEQTTKTTSHNQVTEAQKVEPIDPTELWEKNVVGDILYTLYQYTPNKTQNGIPYTQHADLPIKLLGLGDASSAVEALKSIQTVITVVAGNHEDIGLQIKGPITRICLNEGYTKILVTDSDLANYLVAT